MIVSERDLDKELQDLEELDDSADYDESDDSGDIFSSGYGCGCHSGMCPSRMGMGTGVYPDTKIKRSKHNNLIMVGAASFMAGLAFAKLLNILSKGVS